MPSLNAALALGAVLLTAALNVGHDSPAVAAKQAPTAAPVPVAASDPDRTGVLARREGNQPNIVLVLVDDMRTDDLRFTPNVRRLIRDQGMAFPNNISPHPMCCPARAEIFSGQYAQNNGVRHNEGRYGGFRALAHPDNTIATWMDAAGYSTALHGKFLNVYGVRDGAQKGWDVWDPLVAGVYTYDNFRFFDGDSYEQDYVTTRIQERSEATLTTMLAGDAPFFLMVNHVAPHMRFVPVGDRKVGGPALPAPSHAHEFSDVTPLSMRAPSFNEADMSDKPADIRNRPKVDPAQMRAEFLGRVRSLQSVDESVGHLISMLKESGELANTYVVFASDNGYALGEHRAHKKNLLSAEVLSVPLLVRGPGVRPGSSTNRLTTLVDLSATLVDLTRSVPGARLDGQSLARTLHGLPDRARDTTLVQTGSSRVHGPHPGWDHRGVMTSRFLYGESARKGNHGFLYDHRKDPWELDNVVDDPRYTRIASALRHRLHALETCAGAQCNRRFGRLARPGHAH